MKLRRLTLHGFKSFADRTDLRFHDGITAIVGPNGCGKSNISDAVRWVLGEQRASAIRSQRMDEAIFQGTTERRRLNRAEVELGFSNEDRRLAVPYDEVEIRRTVFREGGSNYELNRSSVRLKDVLEIYRDTGLGANAYSIIEQGMVDAILSDRNEDRRMLFEEAAGVGRYKDRRAAAQRRLESAQADLERLADIVSEVESKVRALGRQRKRAEQHRELRARRLAVEVGVATLELAEVRGEMADLTKRLERLRTEDPDARAELSTAEADLERRRLAAAEAARVRNAAATRLQETNRQIADRERELAVAGERRTHALRRLGQIEAERSELLARRSALEEEHEELRTERASQQEETEVLSGRLEEVQARLAERRQDLVDARQEDERLRAREEELSRRMARLQAEAAGADARAVELQRRLERIDREREELAGELVRLDEQGDLFASRTRETAARMTELEGERDQAAARLEELRAAEIEARRTAVEAEDRANLLAGRLAALEGLDREFHGFSPAVADALARREEIEGLLGPLAEFLELDPDRATRVEASLNSLLQMLVVRDEGAADRLRELLAGQERSEGAVALLRMESVPAVEKLLARVDFAGEAADEPVILGRKARIAALRAEAATAAAEAQERRAARADAAEAAEAAETALRTVEERLRELDLELRRAHADESARAGRRSQVERVRGELDEQREQMVEGGDRMRRESSRAKSQEQEIEAALDAVREERRAASRRVAEREVAWDAVREEEAEVRVLHARAESALASLDRRMTATSDAAEHAGGRIAALGDEESEHRETLSAVDALREESETVLANAFQARDGIAGELREMDARAEEERELLEGLESEVRRMRRSVDEVGEERHQLEMRRAHAEAAERSVRERLEAEWSKPFEELVRSTEAAEGELEDLRAEARRIAADLERLGPVNVLAIEEYEEENQRLQFLVGQRDDLDRAREELETAIREINRTARELFADTFTKVRENFRRTFDALFEGGECDVWLADESDPLETAIEVSASPRGKRTQRIHQLSGGERALTALALLFAIYLVKPSPFCILDEVDAPLDEANIDRFVSMLERFKEDTQFVVITHNPRTMESADYIYGVTMEEAGVSSIVGVRIGDVVGADVA